jgi:hypothetical protein
VRRFLTISLLLGSLATAGAHDAISDTNRDVTEGRVVKVLPLLLDLQGHDAISPSLFDRDAYQAHLRQHTNEISAIRFDVLWKASSLSRQSKPAADARGATLKLRAELLGVGERGLPRQTVLETNVAPRFFRRWTSLTLGGDEFRKFGSLVAWRVTLWNGDRLLGEQKSFLW